MMDKPAGELLNETSGERATFIVQVHCRQNATWQGTVTWTDRQLTRPYRSALELLRLMESAVEGTHPVSDAWERTED